MEKTTITDFHLSSVPVISTISSGAVGTKQNLTHQNFAQPSSAFHAAIIHSGLTIAFDDSATNYD